MSLTVDQKELAIPKKGGAVFLNITSNFDGRSAFKIKMSCLELYRVKPVYGLLEAKASTKVKILRFAGDGKEEKMIIQWAEVPPEETDPQAVFKASAESGEVAIPMKPI